MRTSPAIVFWLVAFLSSLLHAQSVYPTGTTIWQQGSTNDGYTLFRVQEPPNPYFIILIDMDGTEVHRWESSIPNHGLISVDPLDNGNILVLPQKEGSARRRLLAEIDQQANIVWLFEAIDALGFEELNLHHDSERLPNGNTLVLATQEIHVPEISTKVLQDDLIIEVSPSGSVVWTWETWRHFPELGLTSGQQAIIYNAGGAWAHANSIAVIPPNGHIDPRFAEGNIVVSFRNTNSIVIVEKATGSIVWKTGANGNQLTSGQHAPHMITQGMQGAGNLLVFNNGGVSGYLAKNPPIRSSVAEIDPSTKAVVWNYAPSLRFWSPIVGNAQRLPNGNTLICSGVQGRLLEVSPDQQILWEYMNPRTSIGNFGPLVPRAFRVDYGWLQAGDQ